MVSYMHLKLRLPTVNDWVSGSEEHEGAIHLTNGLAAARVRTSKPERAIYKLCFAKIIIIIQIKIKQLASNLGLIDDLSLGSSAVQSPSVSSC